MARNARFAAVNISYADDDDDWDTDADYVVCP